MSTEKKKMDYLLLGYNTADYMNREALKLSKSFAFPDTLRFLQRHQERELEDLFMNE